MKDIRTARDCVDYFIDREAKPAGDTVFDGTAFGSNETESVTIWAQRDGLDRLVADYLAKGGKITKCPPKPRRFEFGRNRPPTVIDRTARDNDLSRRRWRGPVLSPDEERDLIRLAQSGDGRAKDRLVKSFHRQVLKIAGKYFGPAHSDLMAAGMLGFSEAIARFDLRCSRRLSTYAAPWIRKHVLLAVQHWSKDGDSSDTRADRYLFAHPNASVEEIVRAVGGSPKAAQAAIWRTVAHGCESYS